jgi:hypothetical protein
VLVDALDEARDPLGIASSVLRRLARIAGVRTVVGTRRSLTEGPDLPHPRTTELVDALVMDRQRDQFLFLGDEPASISRYVASRLVRTKGSPYQGDLTKAQLLAEQVERRQQPFLFARLAVTELLARTPMEPTSAQLADLLGSGHRGLFARALDRFQAAHPPTVALLRTLAFGLGRGFPRRGLVWSTAAMALHPGMHITDDDIDRTLDLAAPYVTLDGEAGETTLRLAHQTFVEHFQGEA